MSEVTTTSPGPARSAIHLSASSGPCATITVSISGWGEGRIPPFDTTTIRVPCLVPTRSISAFTGQASAST
jgi:hypothetical protein